MSAAAPDVSVIIPTRARSDLVLRAVRSALEQTLTDIECLVVQDGPDPETSRVLAAISDPRVRVVALPQRSGASAARNAGVKESRGRWVAFLDDDDEWFPNKLERQLAVALESQFRLPIVSCRLRFTHLVSLDVLPRRLPRPGDLTTAGALSEYLFRRTSPFVGEGSVMTSSLFVPRELLLSVEFDEQLLGSQDADWLLRAITRPGVGLEFAAEPLGIWDGGESRERVSLRRSWDRSLAWAARMLRTGLVSPKAYASFVLTTCALQASRTGRWQPAWVLLREACTRGRPHALLFFFFAAVWLVPSGLRHLARRLLLRRPQR